METCMNIFLVIEDELKTNSDDNPETDETKKLPRLKLRSFAKQPECWQNSQDVDENKKDKITSDESKKKPIEVVILDDSMDDDNSIQELPQLGTPKRLKSSSGINNRRFKKTHTHTHI